MRTVQFQEPCLLIYNCFSCLSFVLGAVDRLARLRLVLPALGQELATARREAAKLRIENGRLKDRLQRLEASGGLPASSGIAKNGS